MSQLSYKPIYAGDVPDPGNFYFSTVVLRELVVQTIENKHNPFYIQVFFIPDKTQKVRR